MSKRFRGHTLSMRGTNPAIFVFFGGMQSHWRLMRPWDFKPDLHHSSHLLMNLRPIGGSSGTAEGKMIVVLMLVAASSDGSLRSISTTNVFLLLGAPIGSGGEPMLHPSGPVSRLVRKLTPLIVCENVAQGNFLLSFWILLKDNSIDSAKQGKSPMFKSIESYRDVRRLYQKT